MHKQSSQLIQEQVSLEIPVSAEQAFQKMCDFPSYIHWQTAICEVNMEKAHHITPRVEFVADVVIRKFRYTLDYSIDHDNLKMSWDFVRGDIEHVSGHFYVKPKSEKECHAFYALDVDPGFFAPNFLINLIKKTVMVGVLKDLKKELLK
ncbi:MAG: hypothetical protein D6767_05290 [Candidatus Hydrogenedentota bacterium]|nr:MAG: hypothetical protein D6767_05290 [Candidatus Hydrogenedentota bacterium]